MGRGGGGLGEGEPFTNIAKGKGEGGKKSPQRRGTPELYQHVRSALRRGMCIRGGEYRGEVKRKLLAEGKEGMFGSGIR